MPTLADKYIYKGLSGETYPDRIHIVKHNLNENSSYNLLCDSHLEIAESAPSDMEQICCYNIILLL